MDWNVLFWFGGIVFDGVRATAYAVQYASIFDGIFDNFNYGVIVLALFFFVELVFCNRGVVVCSWYFVVELG